MAGCKNNSWGPKNKQRRGYSPLDAIDPRDGKIWQVLLSDDKMDYTASRGGGAALELADTVRWALLNPSSIYRGVRDLERDIVEDDWLCYVATPKHAYDYRTNEKVTPWNGEVFLIYVTDERILYNWYWDEADEDDIHLPNDYENRFLERLFP